VFDHYLKLDDCINICVRQNSTRGLKCSKGLKRRSAILTLMFLKRNASFIHFPDSQLLGQNPQLESVEVCPKKGGRTAPHGN